MSSNAAALTATASAACRKHAPPILLPEQVAALCAAPSDASTGACAQAVLRVPGMQAQDAIALCRDEEWEAAVGCVAEAPRFLTSSARVRLCSGATDESPALCARNIDRRHAMDDSVLVRLCQGAQGGAAARCFSQASRSARLTSMDAASLCAGAPTAQGPQDCAAARPARVLGADDAAQLCGRAADASPAACFAEAPRALATGSRVELCQRSTSAAPALCYRRIRSKRWSAGARIALCRGARSSEAAEGRARCADAASAKLRAFGISDMMRLCEGARDTSPALCAAKAIALGATTAQSNASAAAVPTSVVRLCASATDATPTTCLQRAPDEFCFADRATLCAGARSLAPAACARVAFGATKDAALSARLCAQQESTAIADCIAQAPRALAPAAAAALCRGGIATEPVRCLQEAVRRGVPLDQGAALCRGARSTAPASCASKSPLARIADTVVLCREAGDAEAVVRCARAAPGALTAPQRALLCAKARDSGPALCALHVPSTMVKRVAVALCVGATGELPAQCASRLRSTEPSAREVERCRQSEERATSLRVESVAHDGDRVVTGQAFGVELAVLNQFGYPLQMAREPAAIRAALSPRDAAVAELGGARTQASSASPIAFRDLRIDRAGTFSVRFFLGDREEATVSVAVEWTAEEALYRRCAQLFGRFRSGRWHGEPRGRGARSRAYLSHLDVVRSPACLGALEREGVRAVVGWGFAAWLWFDADVLLLHGAQRDAGAARTPRERLGLEAGAPLQAAKEAYRALSRRWHPDKWTRHPAHQRRAEAIFVDIATAYAALVEEARVHGAGRAPEGAC